MSNRKGPSRRPWINIHYDNEVRLGSTPVGQIHRRRESGLWYFQWKDGRREPGFYPNIGIARLSIEAMLLEPDAPSYGNAETRKVA